MPQNPQKPGGAKKKKKGHAPAHQNKFAFQHNPKSKLTAKILSSPNIHVCQRCHDKIEWRKQYRKYKPRTQPGTCNGCGKRNVKAAYHTICESCTRECSKAKEVIASEVGETETDTKPEEEETLSSILAAPVSKPRACAVCVKELALPDPEEDEENEDLLDKLGKVKLRERKALERKLEREAKEARRKARESGERHEKDDGDRDDEDDDPARSDDGFSPDVNEDDDEDDPFLKAVGGADKLLTGEAYQKKLLAEKLQNQSLQENKDT